MVFVMPNNGSDDWETRLDKEIGRQRRDPAVKAELNELYGAVALRLAREQVAHTGEVERPANA